MKSRAIPVLVLAALTLLAYWPAFGCDFIWDDDDYVTQNPVLRTWGGIASIWFEPLSLPQYYPLVHTTFWLEYRLWGLDAAGYHTTNLLLHLLAGIALWRVLVRLAVPGALFGAALFVAHPIGVESVAWITERKNVLSLCCALFAANAWLRFRDAGSTKGLDRHYWVATLLFLAALLAKTVAASTPAALLVIQWWRHGRLDRRDWLTLVPWIGAGLMFGLATAYLEVTHVRAGDQPWQLEGGERLLVAGRAPWFYLGALVWPAGLCFNYPRWDLDVSAFWQWVPPLGILAALVTAFLLRQRLGRGPLAVLLLFGGMLVPALGFFDVYPFRYSYVADHFQYHASAAMLAGLAAALALATARLDDRLRTGLAAVVLVTLAILASRHVRTFENLETCWQSTIACNPDSTLALTNLGGLKLNADDLDGAERLFKRCLELDAENHESLANLGVIEVRRGNIENGCELLERSIASYPRQPIALTNLASVVLANDDPARAFELTEQALSYLEEQSPDQQGGSFRTRVVHVVAAGRLGKWRELLPHADWVLKRKTDEFDVRLAAAQALLETGNIEGAVQNAGAALKQRPHLSRPRNVFVAAMARVLRTTPPAVAKERAVRIIQSGGFDPAPILPLLTAELRKLGAAAHADAIATGR
ncbi:MAG: O-GlcNAc transferase [bacterium]|nr:O-GlcNAc transferase [bacterium]